MVRIGNLAEFAEDTDIASGEKHIPDNYEYFIRVLDV